MSKIVTWAKTEPTTVQALLQAFMAIGIAFQWWHWSVAQTGAVVGLTAVVLSLVVRSQVVPVLSLRELK